MVKKQSPSKTQAKQQRLEFKAASAATANYEKKKQAIYDKINNKINESKERERVQKEYNRYEKKYAARGKLLDSDDERVLDDAWGRDEDLYGSDIDNDGEAASSPPADVKKTPPEPPGDTSPHSDKSPDTEPEGSGSTPDTAIEVEETEQRALKSKSPPSPISVTSDDESSQPNNKKQATGPSPKHKDATTPSKPPNTSTLTTSTPSFKRVQYNSTNRRQCIRHNPSANDTTPNKSNKIKLTNTYATRVTIKLSLPSSNDPEQVLISTTRQILRELQQSDASCSFVPWKEAELHLPSIHEAKNLPTSITKLRKYLNRCYLPKKNESTTIYANVNLGHNHSFNTIKEDTQAWMNNNLSVTM